MNNIKKAFKKVIDFLAFDEDYIFNDEIRRFVDTEFRNESQERRKHVEKMLRKCKYGFYF